MTATTINAIVASGTNAERLAYTPSLATPASGPDPSVIFKETDTGNTYMWDYGGSAWQQVNGGIADADYGDIVVSGGVWSIDADVVGPTELVDTAVTPGSYTNANITVDQQGRLTAASSGAATSSFRGALVKKSADQTGANYTTLTPLTWNAETYDTSSFHSTSSNTDRITIPAGVSMVRLSGQVRTANLNSEETVFLLIQKNGSSDWDGMGQVASDSDSTSMTLQVSTAIVSVTAGDYFTLAFQTSADTGIDIVAARSWFSVEVIE